MLFEIWRGKKCKIAYIYYAFCNLERYKVQNSLYLVCFLRFGERTHGFAFCRASFERTSADRLARIGASRGTPAHPLMTWTGPADVLSHDYIILYWYYIILYYIILILYLYYIILILYYIIFILYHIIYQYYICLPLLPFCPLPPSPPDPLTHGGNSCYPK